LQRRDPPVSKATALMPLAFMLVGIVFLMDLTTFMRANAMLRPLVFIMILMLCDESAK
jgi:hypothetical protein